MKSTYKFVSVLLVVMLAVAALPASAMAQTPADALPPLVSAVTLLPNPAPAATPVVITATLDDTASGASALQSAEYSVNSGPWSAMTAVDGAFDTALENVTATFTPAASGMQQVCVRGADIYNNLAEPVCDTLSVQFVFKGFFSPFKMGKEYKANAGRTIPVKWQLKNANGKPVSDKAAILGLKSYPVDCVTLSGDVTTATLEKSPGKSALKYQGSGKWMYNWKTAKEYKATCRKMFVEFSGGQLSPEVVVRFK